MVQNVKHQYIRLDFDERLFKLGTTSLNDADVSMVDAKLMPVGKELVPMSIQRTDEGYSVTVDTAGRCVGRILNSVNNHIKEWVSEI